MGITVEEPVQILKSDERIVQTNRSQPIRGRLIASATAAAVALLFLIASPAAAARQTATDCSLGRPSFRQARARRSRSIRPMSRYARMVRRRWLSV